MRGPSSSSRLSGAKAETRDASEVPHVCSVPVVKTVVHKVVRFDRVELRHVVTAERRREDCGEDN